MRRRDFLKSAAAVGARGLVPGSLLMLAAPEWVRAMTPGTWTAICGGAGYGSSYQNGARILDVVPSPMPTCPAATPHYSGIVDSWGGGTVDQQKGELLFVCNGGHADYPGNESYALAFRNGTPAWRRLTEPTPNSVMSVINSGYPTEYYYPDGFPRSMHTSGFPTFGDYKVWFPFSNSVTDAAGNSVDQVSSFNRYDATLLSYDNMGQVLPYSVMTTYGATGPTSTPIGPYNYYGTGNVTNLGNNAPFGYGIFDRWAHRVYGFSNYSTSALAIWSFPTIGASAGVSSGLYTGGATPPRPAWICSVYDLRLIVFGANGGYDNGTVWVYDIASEIANGGPNKGTLTQVTNITGTGWYGATVGSSGMCDSGAAYVARNRSIAVGSPRDIAGTIYKLAIPTTTDSYGRTVYNPSGQWVWTNFTPSGASTNPANWIEGGLANDGTFSKWNIIENMGDGNSGIVFCGRVEGPTYVYKIPSAGL